MMVAPELDRLLRRLHREGITLHGKNADLVYEICDILNELEPQGDNELHKYWFKLSRGTVDDYDDYEEMLDCGEVQNEQEYLDCYHRDYPYEEKWYLFITIRHNNYASIIINYRKCFSADGEIDNDWAYSEDSLRPYLTACKDIALQIIRQVKEEDYFSWVEKVLPNRYRFGLIDCKKFWELYPESEQIMHSKLSESDLNKFTLLMNQTEIQDVQVPPAAGLKTLTAAKYKEILSYAYRKLYPDETKDMSIEKMYHRYADDRDGGLSTIDQDDPDAFTQWYDLPSSEKWEKYGNPSHLWEAVEGGSITRMHLCPYYKEGIGWYFAEYASLTCCQQDAALMFLALVENGIPVKLQDGKEIADILNGNCKVGIIPCFHSPFEMMYGGFPKEHVYTFVNFEDGLIQIENEIEWLSSEIV